MTQEEIIQAISDDKMMPFIQPDQLAQIVAFVIKNYQPYLPSDLDEAAEEEYPDFSNSIASKAAVDAVRDAFKTGSKWMAEQGYSQEEIVEDKSIEVGYGVLPGITPIINLPDSFKPGDRVIVQIRKK